MNFRRQRRYYLHTVLLAVVLFSEQVYSENFGKAAPQAILKKSSIETKKVRVKLATFDQEFELNGSQFVIQGEESEVIPVAIPSLNQTIRISLDRLRGKQFWRVTTEVAGVRKIKFYSDKILAIKGSQIYSKSTHLPSEIVLTIDQKINLIGYIPLRDYLYGVVAKEMPASWPLEALKAQAVTARSYVLYMMKERVKDDYDVESTMMDQVYSRIESLNMDTRMQNAVMKAVNDTEGIYLKHKDGNMVKTFYHADCGGVTASSKSVFGSAGLIGGVRDKSCPLNPKARWVLNVTAKNLGKKLAMFFGGREKDYSVENISTVQDPLDQRVQSLNMTMSSGLVKKISGYDLRALLGYDQLRSGQFNIQKIGNTFQLIGKGFGHGVGLCQWGSKQLAMHGESYQKILAHYYPELQIRF